MPTPPTPPTPKIRDLVAEQAKRKPRLIAETRAEILRLLEQAAARIRLKLAQQPGEAERWVLASLQAEIRQAMTEFGDAAAAWLSTAAGSAWQAGQDLVDVPLAAGGVRLAGLAPVLDTRQLLAMRAFMADRIKDIGVQAINRINTALGLVVIGASAPTEAISTVTRVLDEGSRSRAITIVRTEISRVHAVAAHGRMVQAAEHVPDLQKQWRRSGKVHSRLHHDMADGQVRPVDEPFVLATGARLMFPHDPAAPAGEVINCGCTALPWMADWGMLTPGRRRYTELEMERNPMKRDIQEQIDSGRSMADILDAARGGKAA